MRPGGVKIMFLNDVNIKESALELADGGAGRNYDFTYEGGGVSSEQNEIFAGFSVDELVKALVPAGRQAACGGDFYFYGSGWQSWGFGGELPPGHYEKPYIPLAPQVKHYFTFPGTPPKELRGQKRLLGTFISYLRWGTSYLVFASTGAVGAAPGEPLPPVQFWVSRKDRTVTCAALSDGAEWKTGDRVARISVFFASSYFSLKSCVKALYCDGRFARLSFLSGTRDRITAAGWESWYNHYANINQKLIGDDLASLSRTGNLIKRYCIDEGRPVVFQIDDGWEVALGDWRCDEDKFPDGMRALSKAISAEGYVPGLWIAPFIIDFRSEFCRTHTDWLLRDKSGGFLEAGYSAAWGGRRGEEGQPGRSRSYYCLDLSREDVLGYLDALMEKVINEWFFRYLKLDFLFAGAIVGAFTNKGVSYKNYVRAIRLLTRRTTNMHGEPVAYLGCGLPFELSFNTFPLSRIGSDTTEKWDSMYKLMNLPVRPSALINLQDTLGHAFWDQAVFVNDPDVVFLRSENIAFGEREKELIALVNFLFASQIMHSDDPAAFKEETEGRFTDYIYSLYKRFEGAEFGLQNIDETRYAIFSRDGRYFGFINLSGAAFKCEKSTLFSMCSLRGTERLKGVTSHFKETPRAFTFEPRSISIFEVVN